MRKRFIGMVYPIGTIVLMMLIILNLRLAHELLEEDISMLGKVISVLLTVSIGGLFLRVLKQRLQNKEDDYYSKNINQ